MKHIKTFEKLTDKFNIGDYVILKSYKDMNEFLNNNIGQITYIKPYNKNDYNLYTTDITVLYPYDIIPEKLKDYFKLITSKDLYTSLNKIKQYSNLIDKLNIDTNKNTTFGSRLFETDDIIYHSTNKEELDAILSQNKFNL